MQIDLKFDDRFQEALWSGKKTTTIRRSLKGEEHDWFLVRYGDTEMEFVITKVDRIGKLTEDTAENVYRSEGFRDIQDMMDYCADRGYTNDLYLHRFRLVRQRRISDGTVTTSATLPAKPCQKDFKYVCGRFRYKRLRDLGRTARREIR